MFCTYLPHALSCTAFPPFEQSFHIKTAGKRKSILKFTLEVTSEIIIKRLDNSVKWVWHLVIF